LDFKEEEDNISQNNLISTINNEKNLSSYIQQIVEEIQNVDDG
jgi:hypothetical protein